MNWLNRLFTSSVGQKLIMGLTGIFLILFLVVHLAGNLQLLNDDGGASFNKYAYFMTHNPLIKFISYGLYVFILLHAIQGVVLALSNRKARGRARYAVKPTASNSFASRNMALLGILIFAFLCIHMGDFWYKMKFTDQLAVLNYESIDEPVKDLYRRVSVAFDQLWIVIVYIIGQVALGFHLIHGFQSAFQTLGLEHRKYTPAIKIIGVVYSILIPLGFAVIPIYHYFFL